LSESGGAILSGSTDGMCLSESMGGEGGQSGSQRGANLIVKVSLFAQRRSNLTCALVQLCVFVGVCLSGSGVAILCVCGCVFVREWGGSFVCLWVCVCRRVGWQFCVFVGVCLWLEFDMCICLDGYCSTVQGLLDWFAVDLGFTELLIVQIDLCVCGSSPTCAYVVSVCLCLVWCVCVSVCLCVCVSVCLCFCMYEYAQVSVSACVSVCLCVYVSVCLCLGVSCCLSICRCECVSMCLVVYLYVCVS